MTTELPPGWEIRSCQWTDGKTTIAVLSSGRSTSGHNGFFWALHRGGEPGWVFGPLYKPAPTLFEAIKRAERAAQEGVVEVKLMLDWKLMPQPSGIPTQTYRAILETIHGPLFFRVGGKTYWFWGIKDRFSLMPLANSDYPHETPEAAMYAAERAAKRRGWLK